MASSPPQFFRLLLQRNLEDGKLMIPKKFVKHHGKCLSSSVRLKVPDGLEWKVGVSTTPNGVVWLHKGWHKFTDHYSLEFGSLLVFKLDGASTFQTTIFDPTGLETDYCCNFTQQFQHEQDSEQRPFDDEVDSDESSDSFPLLSNNRNRASVRTGSRSRKRIKVSNGDSLAIKTEPQEDESLPSFKKRVPRARVGVSEREQRFANNAEAAQRFISKSEKPCFKVAMKSSNVGGRFNLVIPRDFAQKYLSQDFGMIKLRTVNGKNWSLLYKWSRGTLAYISSGWKAFVQENHLKEGVVGVFELLSKDTFSFKLQKAPPSPSTLQNKIKTCNSTPRNPFFEVNICVRSYRKTILYIPMPFAKEHLSHRMHYAAKLQVGNRQWIVTIKYYRGSVRFSAGWCSFYGDNGLKDGDTCLFEMISERKCVFEVTILRKV